MNEDIEQKFEEYKKWLKENVIPDGDSDEKYIHILELKSSILPKSLFRYRSCNYNNFAALLDDKIYFSASKDFNDPHDCLSYVDVNVVNSLSSYGEMRDFINELFDLHNRLRNGESRESIFNSANKSNVTVCAMMNLLEYMGEFKADSIDAMFSIYAQYSRSKSLEESRNETFIACLSQTIFSTLMWAHYAEYHKGFALGYDAKTLQKVLSDDYKIQLWRVIYGDERYDATEHEIDMLKMRPEHGSNFHVSDNLAYIKKYIYKGLDWKYEEEWRAFRLQPQGGNPCVAVKPNAIYLGSQMSESHKNIILKLIEGKDIKIYEMYLDKSSTEYKLDYKPV